MVAKVYKQQEVELRVRLVSTGEYLYYRGQRMYVLVDKDESYVDIMKASYLSEQRRVISRNKGVCIMCGTRAYHKGIKALLDYCKGK